MKIKLFTIPNLLTLSNLFCGSAAVVSALVWGDLKLAFGLMVLAAVFDFFDGFAARLLNQSSPIGLQLDSLADDISFGLAPAAIMYSLYQWMPGIWLPEGYPGLAVFVFTACAALRLAKFNIDDTQRTEFCGLPSPAAAMLCGSLGLLFETSGLELPREAISAIAVVVGLLMISNVRMFALKFHGFGWKGNELRYGFIIAAARLRRAGDHRAVYPRFAGAGACLPDKRLWESRIVVYLKFFNYICRGFPLFG